MTRPKQYADRLRRYRIVVDDIQVAMIKAGERVEINLPIGRHQVFAAIDWARSNSIEIDVLPGRCHHLEVGSNLSGWRLLLAIAYATIWRQQYLYRIWLPGLGLLLHSVACACRVEPSTWMLSRLPMKNSST